jgi:hypothetical protein
MRRPIRARFIFACVVLSSAAAAIGCRPTVDLAAGLRVNDVATGWVDAGPANGVNKLVPTVSFALTNVSGETLQLLQVNAVFRRAGGQMEWGARFASAADPKGLAPGETTRVLMLSSDLGYTGADPHEAMLRNSRFVDTDVDVFAKYGSSQWVRLGRFPVQRQLMARR